MPFIITHGCIACGTCKLECPENAIEYKGDKYDITGDCIECANCYENCPSGAIVDG
jgi:NAD-dependent dihydropyrimidine dehydrogenase PreA subunit